MLFQTLCKEKTKWDHELKGDAHVGDGDIDNGTAMLFHSYKDRRPPFTRIF